MLKTKMIHDIFAMLPAYNLSNYGTFLGAFGLLSGNKVVKETGTGLVIVGLASKFAAQFF